MQKNLILPGNPRYQPKSLIDIFGYDNLYHKAMEVEFAAMHSLHKIGFIPSEQYALLTPQLEAEIIDKITTTMVDKIEREITHHDIRALVRLIQENLPLQLRRFVHVPLTSYDVLDTARVLQFREAFQLSLNPSLIEIQKNFIDLIRENNEKIQIGRTHGQHALPITVGFWLATILSRIFNGWEKLTQAQANLKGKISGAVGAYNAQDSFKMDNFEYLTLDRLNLKASKISTQILPPENFSDFLYACLCTSAALGQFGRDCRHLMRSEIGEVAEFFEAGQIGSSTMSQKRNPINFENLEGMFLRNRAEFIKVTDVLISEHQRDLVGSSIMRDFPIIIINLQQQLDVLNRKKEDKTFLERITFNEENLEKNFRLNANYILAEPIYLALQLYGYEGDAHKLINELTPIAQKNKTSLLFQLTKLAENDEKLNEVIMTIPFDLRELLKNPKEYTGAASIKAIEIAYLVLEKIKKFI